MLFSPVLNKPNKAKCDTCGNEYSYRGGSTSNLYLHIRTNHPSLASGLSQSKKRRAGESSASATADVRAPVNDGEQGLHGER